MRGRLLFIIGTLDIGGAERHLLQVLPHLQARGFKLAIYTIGRQGTLASEFMSAGISVYSPPMANSFHALPYQLGKPLLLLVSVFRLFILLLVQRPKVVHFFLPEAYLVGGLVSLLMPGLQRVMSRRSLDHYQLRFPFLSLIERWLHPRMDVVLGNSRSVTRQLANEGVVKDHLGLIYNGLDASVFEAPFDKARMRTELGLNSDSLVLVLIANLIPYKGHADLLNALGMINDKLPENWNLLCVGCDNGIGDDLQSMAQELSISSHIKWMGSSKDVIRLLRLSDIGLMCSHQEGFSNAILEGMAASLPMIVTDVGGNTEAVIDGVTGIVVPPKNSKILGEALLNLASDKALREKMGFAAYELVEKNFTLDACVKKYEQLYVSLIKGMGLPDLDDVGLVSPSNSKKSF